MSDERERGQPGEASACVPEWTLSVYVDHELEPHEVRSVDAHLVGCRACRELVVTLQDETTSLRAALSLEETAPVAAAPTQATQSLALSGGATIAATLAGATALGWLLALPIPSALEWLNPFDLGAMFTMFFDAVSLSREQAPALYQFVVASAALFSVAFLLTSSFTLATRRLVDRRGVLLLLGLLGLSAATPTDAFAIEVLTGDETVSVAADEVVEQAWVTTAESVDIEGTLRGDLVALGDRVVISGVLDGNLVSAARRVEIEGHVTGSVVAVGERVRISGTVDGNVYTGAGQTTITESGRIGRDLTTGGEGLTLSGTVERDLLAHLEWLELRGAVGRDGFVVVELGDVLATARIGGDLDLRHREEPSGILVDEAASVGGEIRVVPAHHEIRGFFHRYSSPHFYIYLVLSLAAAFLFGMMVFRLAPWVFGSRIENGGDLVGPLGFGFVTVFATPIALLLVALTVVGIPIAVAGLAVWALCLYLAKIVVGAAVGVAILGRPEESQWREFALPLIAGLTIISVATAIPVLGGVLGFLTLLVGVGALVLQVRERASA